MVQSETPEGAGGVRVLKLSRKVKGFGVVLSEAAIAAQESRMENEEDDMVQHAQSLAERLDSADTEMLGAMAPSFSAAGTSMMLNRGPHATDMTAATAITEAGTFATTLAPSAPQSPTARKKSVVFKEARGMNASAPGLPRLSSERGAGLDADSSELSSASTVSGIAPRLPRLASAGALLTHSDASASNVEPARKSTENVLVKQRLARQTAPTVSQMGKPSRFDETKKIGMIT